MNALSTPLRELRAVLQPRLGAIVLATMLWSLFARLVLLPSGLLLLRALLEVDGFSVVADSDLLSFALSAYGALVIAVLAALALGLALAGQALALAILQAPPGRAVQRVASAFALLRARVFDLLRLALRVVLRAAWIAAPFAVAIYGVSRLCLAEHDINYYLDEHPPAFWIALGLGGALAAGGAAALLAQLAAWGLALPCLLFEGLPAHAALRASEAATKGTRRSLFAQALGWAIACFALETLLSSAWIALGRFGLAAWDTATLRALVVSTGLWLLGAALLECAIGAFRAASLAALQQSWHRSLRPSAPAFALPSPRRRYAPALVAAALCAGALVSFGAGALALFDLQPIERCRVIAHRGASHVAPENSIAAVRAAIDARADAVEIDVQETQDGLVVVLHDRDLARMGGVPLAVASSTSEALRSVDIGSCFHPRFASERVPLLDEVLALARGRIHVLIELKRYVSGGRLPELVIERVESAGMSAQISCMSMDPELVRRLRALRPGWSIGALSAVALGDMTAVDAAFLAVRATGVSRRFLLDAHAVGKETFVWTVNDSVALARAFALGVDGVITDRPELAVALRAERAELSGVERALAQLAGLIGAPLGGGESEP